MNLTFDPEAHVYRLDGRLVPGVTRVLQDEGLVDASHFTEYSRDRGTKAHRAIELYDAEDLAEEDLDPVLRPYLEAWRRFKAEAGVTIEASEVRLSSETYRFAGTIDKIGSVGGNPAIIDIKTAARVESWWAIQLAGYHILVNEPARKRYAVQLGADGGYRLHQFKERSDREVFLAALTVHNWKRRASGN